MGKRKGKATGGKAAKRFKKRAGFSDDEAEEPRNLGRLQHQVGRELQAIREEQEEGELPPVDVIPVPEPVSEGAETAAEKAEGEKDGEKEEEKPDPYLLADATYIQKETRWRNKQRTLIFASRGITAQFRYLMEDMKKLLPHHKSEPKFEKKVSLQEINEICELKSCNNVVYFEARKHKDLYMWVSRVPSGPCMKFQVLNLHTTGEIRLAGNCLQGSRPILFFDKKFSDIPFLKLFRELIQQAWGVPRNHPKSKPFHDHVMSFYYLDRKIWFRHYQISPETPDDLNDPERQTLTEIGPRFVLDPIRILSGSFSGQCLYANPNYMSPTALRCHLREQLRSPFTKQAKIRQKRRERVEAAKLPDDPLGSVFT